jgi:hypothetical protein
MAFGSRKILSENFVTQIFYIYAKKYPLGVENI